MKKLVTQPATKRNIRLTSKGDLSVIFLGTGAAFSKKFYQTNFLIIKGDDHLLVDCGTKCTFALKDLGLDFTKIKNYYLTHSHADHIGGIEEVMLVYRYLLKSKPNIYITPEYQDILWDHSICGGTKYSEKDQLNRWLEFEDFWNIIRPKENNNYNRETWEAQIGSINIKMPRTCHFPENARSWKEAIWSTGIIIDDRIFFSCDTIYDYDLILDFEEKHDIEWFFHDCQFFTGGIHASLEELNKLPARIKERVILCHYGDTVNEYQQKIPAYGFHSFAKQLTYYHFDA